jgi:hypothetical protein
MNAPLSLHIEIQRMVHWLTAPVRMPVKILVLPQACTLVKLSFSLTQKWQSNAQAISPLACDIADSPSIVE